ncbi:hypothetical protein GCM10010156_36430 [Planobispora rosea]|uniref:Uncharacterized protein n=1 Tax=Planobispora rosea TaxID=35762 RepID=A0A8J3RXC4_PLARO|nr:hypothetical protein [Planobispora rosea]GGS74201.1 hypothetical protein GCM10010156_36430 [Planobispora rosea]GIH81717.1 hypothetical protein Pro02_01250 [Planobispora rosea]
MTRKIPPTHPVTPGSVWRDRRDIDGMRTLRVESIDGERAVCTTLTNSSEVHRRLMLAAEHPEYGPLYGNVRDMRGSTTRILLDRFRPTCNGFDLVTTRLGQPSEDDREQARAYIDAHFRMLFTQHRGMPWADFCALSDEHSEWEHTETLTDLRAQQISETVIGTPQARPVRALLAALGHSLIEPSRSVRDAAPTPPRTVAAPRNPAHSNGNEVTSS